MLPLLLSFLVKTTSHLSPPSSYTHQSQRLCTTQYSRTQFSRTQYSSTTMLLQGGSSRIRPSYCRLFTKSGISITSISSESNNKYKLMKSLLIKKYRDKERLILVEGHRSIIDAIHNGLMPKYIFITNKAFDAPMGRELEKALKGLDVNVDEISDGMMRSITETVTNQGVCGAFDMPISTLSLPITATLIVICDGIKDPGNLGTIFRTSYGLGVDALVLTDDCCDPYSPKVLRSAMGTVLSPLLPFIQSDWNSIPQLLGHGFQSLVCDAQGIVYDQIDACIPTVLVLGSEAIGVRDAAYTLNKCTRISIPMQRGLESLNVGVAASIVLGEVSRQRRQRQT